LIPPSSAAPSFLSLLQARPGKNSSSSLPASASSQVSSSGLSSPTPDRALSRGSPRGESRVDDVQGEGIAHGKGKDRRDANDLLPRRCGFRSALRHEALPLTALTATAPRVKPRSWFPDTSSATEPTGTANTEKSCESEGEDMSATATRARRTARFDVIR